MRRKRMPSLYQGAGRIAPAPFVPEAPSQVPGLKAWFDSRDPAYFTFGLGTEVVQWNSRGGSIAGLSWAQASSPSRPLRNPSVALLGGRPAVQWDGVDDSFLTSNQAAWTFLHNGTGHSNFRIYRTDSTGGSGQNLFANQSNVVHSGTRHILSSPTSVQLQIVKGVTPALNAFIISNANHTTRNVSRWHMLGHGAAVAHSRVAGSSLTNPDGSAPASTAASNLPARLGSDAAGTGPFKGFIAQDIYYDHVLTAAETQLLAEWARAEYGVQGYLEAPMLIPGLKCWFDGRDPVLTTSSGITSVLGSMGTVSLGQVTSGFRPAYVTAAAEFGGRASLLFDGVDDHLVGTTPADWTFLHNGSGSSWFLLERMDSTGTSNQGVLSTQGNAAAETGVSELFGTSLLVHRVANGSGTSVNAWNIANASHYARNVARWRGASHVAGVRTSVISGSTLSNADTAGQAPSAAAPTTALRLGRTASSHLKGWVPQLLIYNRVLTSAEWAQLGAWAASQYPGVAA